MTETRPIVGDDLTDNEKALLDKLFSNPRIWPDTAKTWIADYVSQNSYLPASQLSGIRGTVRYWDRLQDDLSLTTTTLTTLYTKRLPGRTVTPGDTLEATLFYTAMCTDAANSITLRWWLGGVNIFTTSIDAASLDGSARPGLFRFSVTNMGSFSEQFQISTHIFQGGSAFSVLLNERTIDLSADQTLELTAQWASAGTQDLVRKFVGITIDNPIPEKS